MVLVASPRRWCDWLCARYGPSSTRRRLLASLDRANQPVEGCALGFERHPGSRRPEKPVCVLASGNCAQQQVVGLHRSTRPAPHPTDVCTHDLHENHGDVPHLDFERLECVPRGTAVGPVELRGPAGCVLNNPITVSASALSHESPVLPTDGSMPAWASRSVYRIDRYCLSSTARRNTACVSRSQNLIERLDRCSPAEGLFAAWCRGRGPWPRGRRRLCTLRSASQSGERSGAAAGGMRTRRHMFSTNRPAPAS